MSEKDSCPLCGADFTYGETGQYSRKIGVVIPGAYDGILFWICPDCDGRWHRFPETHYLHERAARYINISPKKKEGI